MGSIVTRKSPMVSLTAELSLAFAATLREEKSVRSDDQPSKFSIIIVEPFIKCVANASMAAQPPPSRPILST
jgi:hypothetical protein